MQSIDLNVEDGHMWLAISSPARHTGVGVGKLFSLDTLLGLPAMAEVVKLPPSAM